MTEKVAVITGVGPGLGASLCRRLHREGYKVAGLARSEGFGKELESELSQAGSAPGSANFRHFCCDLAEPTAVRETIADIENLWGAPDVLIHNASQILIKPALEISAKEFESVWRVTCLGGMSAAKAVIPGMRKKGQWRDPLYRRDRGPAGRGQVRGLRLGQVRTARIGSGPGPRARRRRHPRRPCCGGRPDLEREDGRAFQSGPRSLPGARRHRGGLLPADPPGPLRLVAGNRSAPLLGKVLTQKSSDS